MIGLSAEQESAVAGPKPRLRTASPPSLADIHMFNHCINVAAGMASVCAISLHAVGRDEGSVTCCRGTKAF